ncbi:putative Peptidase M3A/M3B catalytic domain-containing protein [Seiridium cardinale]|uniref:Peptidase M3A/M3B catalytic domain-containing protein n=1 Tax=Seiridium cardinale TaxID=138064 RepID=A0ABR2XNG4_9PEZI
MKPPQALLKGPKATEIIPMAQECLETQDVARDALKLWREAGAKCSLRGNYYELLQSALQKELNEPMLDHPEPRFRMDELIKEYEKCGFGKLSEKEIEGYLKGRLEIDELCSQYKRNVG